jgi:predicted dehydrogenase
MPPPVKSHGNAKDIFNIAVIGAGAIGLDHTASFQKDPRARVAVIAEISPARGREAADKFGVPELVTDYKKLLARPDIDIFSIALPNHLHVPVALAALRAGKHVMLDKPMATSATGAAKLVAEARKQKRLLMVGQNNRFAPEVQTAKKLIAGGVLGDVYHAKTAWTRRAGIPRIGSWFTQKKYAGGGATYDIGVHALDRCLYLLGEFDAAAVSGQTYSKFGPRGLGGSNWGRGEIDAQKPFDVDDLSIALIKLRSGRAVLLETSWAAHQPVPDFNGTQLFGTSAGILFPPLQLFRDTPRGYVTELVKTSPAITGTANRMEHFIDCLLGKAEPFVKPEESLAVQKILDAIYRSAKTGREVRIQ